MARRWRLWRWLVAATLVLVLLAGIVFYLFNPRLTRLVESPEFRAELDKQTSKGLHFSGQYEDIRRTGLFSAGSPGFKADDGVKAMQSLSADDISATFNPLGVLLRRWQFDSIHIKRGKVLVQKYEPKPPPPKPEKPWYAIFLPDRVYLREVVCDTADINWKIRQDTGGIYGARLLITPYGERDFDYQATGGKLRMTPLPELPLQRLHMVITKKEMTLHEMTLTPSDKSFIRLEAHARTKEDKSVEAQARFEDVPIARWVPKSWGSEVRGTASGAINWKSRETNLDSSHGDGWLKVKGARLLSNPFAEYVASATRNPDLEQLDLQECAIEFRWKYPELTVQSVRLEADKAFRLTGSLTIKNQALSGEFEFGISPENLDWLPKARETIFTREKGGYLWTTVRLSGTVSEPQNDLTPRIEQALRRSPAAATGLFFRQVGEWFEQTFSKGE